MEVLKYLLYGVLYLYVFFLLIVVSMQFYRLKLENRMTMSLMVIGGPPMLLAFLIDVLSNWTVAWLLFWNRPQELLVTTRLERYMGQRETDYRKVIAVWLCELLARFDPRGQHCFPRN